MMITSEISSLIKVSVGLVLCFVVLKWLWKLLDGFWITPKRLEKCLKRQGLIGNSYKFLVGDLKENSKLRDQAKNKPLPFTHDYFSRIQPLLHKLLQTSEKSCYTWMGPVPTVLITEHELIRDVFTRMNLFKKPKLNYLVEILFSGLVRYEGEKWAKHRKIVNPAFHMEKLKFMLPAFQTSISEELEKWEGLVTKTGSTEIDVWPSLLSITADGISRAAFGSSFQDGRKIFDLITEQKEIVMSNIKYSFIPGWKYMPTKANRRLESIHKEIQDLLNGIIGRRKKAMEEGEPAKDDVLGILLESNFREAKLMKTQNVGGKKQYALSFPEMVEECKLFYNAGQETTAVLLVWTMILLGKHQDWQAQAREEVLATFGKNKPDFDGLNNRLKIVTMILYEVLRLYPPVGATSRRLYDRETKLGDLTVPPGVVLSVSILHAHLDPKVWGDDAKEFNPERFSQGIAKATKGTNAYLPFGWGPRICIGQNFALLEAKMALAMILQCFSFELSPSYIHAPTSLTALTPQHGAHLILQRI
ncbi:cytochrome P450 72A397-like [Amaranthus tricolor]|uniref:cytochrome P450 72A397-like n=1 Tax=Amaranthus tricolor TaxID=29722 RepID=UPI00258AB2E5|nr:cytochrome P450 72A397-like [Amaranthus tricolor]